MPRDLVLVVKAREGQSASRALYCPSSPAASPLGATSCKGKPSLPRSQGPGPSYHYPPSLLPKNMPERCPLLAAGILRTAWGEAPTRVHGCPLVAMRGVECQATQTLPFGRGNSQFLMVLSSQHLQFQVSQALCHQPQSKGRRSHLGELTAGSTGQDPGKNERPSDTLNE